MAIEFSQGVIGRQGISVDGAGDYLVGSVTYRLVIDDVRSGPYTSAVKASAGSRREDPIEIEMPPGYEGPLKYDDFAACVEDYFRGPNMVGFGAGEPGSNITISNSSETNEKHYVRHYHRESERCALPEAS